MDSHLAGVDLDDHACSGSVSPRRFVNSLAHEGLSRLQWYSSRRGLHGDGAAPTEKKRRLEDAERGGGVA